MRLRMSSLIAATLILSGCSDNPLAPSQPGAGETVYTVATTQGISPVTFSFNFSRLRPSRGAQLVAGQEVQVVVRCSKPAGWEMVARLKGSNGPGSPSIPVPMFDTRGTRDLTTNQRSDNFFVGSCADHDQGTAYSITANEPDIPYIRLEAWAIPTASMPGRWVAGPDPGFGWPAGPSGEARSPVVADERVDWRKP